MNDHSSVEAETIPEDNQHLSNMYRLLALTMRYPEPDFVTADFFDLCQQLLATIGMEDAQQNLLRWRQETTSPLDDLQVEYTRLFINAVPRVIAPPFASVYLDEGSLQSRSTEKTRDWYRAHGYDIKNPAVPADFICYELEFLAGLALEGCRHEESEFLRTMFCPWFSEFKQRVLEESGHPFYRMSMGLIDFFTKEEQ